VRRLMRRLHRWFRRRGGPAILMYHRIATPDADPWGLSVSPKRFAEQVRVLRARRTMLAMDDFVARLQSRDLPHDAVALTFDDGYLDNLRQAKPILEAAGVPATVFLTTGRIGTDEEFWWDELARMVLCRAEPLSASVTVQAASLQIDLLPIDAEIEPRVTWRAWDRPATAREAAYQALWHALRACTPESREGAMAQLRGVFGATPPNPEDLPMRAADVRRLVSDHISIGAHGRTHQLLPGSPIRMAIATPRPSIWCAGPVTAGPVARAKPASIPCAPICTICRGSPWATGGQNMLLVKSGAVNA
jgi:peptidoglycan/xylan/chitin deacetylase (PgdA/CDA1 family)